MRAPHEIELREFPKPESGPDEGLLRIERRGICANDTSTMLQKEAIARGGTKARPRARLKGS